MLFEDMCYQDGESITFQRFIQPKVEAEIALVLKHDLDQKQHSIENIIAATDYAVAAIEVVDSRIENWKISLLDTVADNASSAALVLGNQKVSVDQIDWVNCRMKMTHKGNIVSEGQGKACLENPLNAAVWLADEMVRRGRPLLAGDIILTGALGTWWGYMQAMSLWWKLTVLIPSPQFFPHQQNKEQKQCQKLNVPLLARAISVPT